MHPVMLTRAQKDVLKLLTRQDLQAIRKNPHLVSGARHLAAACKKIIKKVETLPKYSGRKRRETAHGRIVRIAQRALDKSGL